MDKKFTVGIETSANTQGIEAVRARLAELEKEANSTGKSFESLAAAEFGDLSGAFDGFSKEIEAAKKQLQTLSAQGVDVKVAATNLDDLQGKLRNLRAEVGVDVAQGEITDAKQKIDQLGREPVVKVAVADDEIVEASQKLDKLDANDIEVSADTRAALTALEAMQARVNSLGKAAADALSFDVNSGEIEGLARRLAGLHQSLEGVKRGTTAFDKIQAEIRQTSTELAKLSKAQGFTGTKKGAAEATQTVAKLQGNVAKLQGQLRKFKGNSAGLRGINAQIGSLDKTVSKAGSSFAAANKSVGPFGSAISSLGGPIGKATAGIASLTGVLALFKQGVANASATEDLTAQFTILLGSIDKANARIGELREFAAATPFSLAGLSEASRVLETITAGALSTGDGLRLVGDLAAGTGEDFRNLSVHVGRLYDGLQNGAPVGESMLRLQELGIITAETRREIEALQKQNKTGSALWELATRDFNRFSGAMEARSKTLSGVWSTLKDNFSQLLATLGAPVRDSLTVALSAAIPVIKATTAAVSGLLQFLGLLDKTAGKAGEDTEKAFARMAEASRKAGKAAGKAAEAQRDAAESAEQSFTRLEARLGTLTAASQAYADAVTDRRIAEIEASGLEEEEKKTKIFEIQSQARLATFEREQSAIEKRRAQATETLESLERQRDATAPKLEAAKAQLNALQEEEDLRKRLKTLADEKGTRADEIKAELKELRDFDKGVEGLGIEMPPETRQAIELLSDALKLQERGAARAVQQLEDLGPERTPDAEGELRTPLNETIERLKPVLAGLKDDIKTQEKLRKDLNRETLEEERRNRKLFREQERTNQANFASETRKIEEGLQKDKAKEAESALKDVQKSIVASDKALASKAKEVLELAKSAGKAKPEFLTALAGLISDLGDGADASELADLGKLTDRLKDSRVVEANVFGGAIEALLASRDEQAAQIAKLTAKVESFEEPEKDLGPLAGKSLGIAFEKSGEIADKLGSGRVARGIREARGDLEDGATIEELRALQVALRQVNTAQHEGVRAMVQEAATNTNITVSLFTQVTNEQRRQANQLANLGGQIKNLR